MSAGEIEVTTKLLRAIGGSAFTDHERAMVAAHHERLLEAQRRGASQSDELERDLEERERVLNDAFPSAEYVDLMAIFRGQHELLVRKISERKNVSPAANLPS